MAVIYKDGLREIAKNAALGADVGVNLAPLCISFNFGFFKYREIKTNKYDKIGNGDVCRKKTFNSLLILPKFRQYYFFPDT